jgi:glyoxylase-like metal-dependent hydrolase (beta-lactamase superfamily II)
MQVSRHAHALTGLGFIPPWSVNAGFVAGRTTTLVIDTGPSRFAAQTVLGYAESAHPGNRILAVNTERHTDHLLGNAYFRDRGVDVMGHPSIARTPEDTAAEIDLLNRCIPDARRREAGEAAVFFSGTGVANPNVRLSEDTVLDLGGLEVRLLMTPGHTEANLSVFVADDGTVFTGDCVVAGFLPNLEDPSMDAGAWLDSLDRLEALHAEVLVPGHGDVLFGGDVGGAIGRMRAFIGRTADRRKQGPFADG